jgi:hypothetical protein
VNWKLSQIQRYCESKGCCTPEEKTSTPSSKPLPNFGFRRLSYAVEEPYRRIVEEVAAYVAERGTLEKEKYNELYGR